MLGFLVRLLPFWVREPLLILVGSVFGVRIMYMAVVDGEGWVPAAIGAVFLLATTLRVRIVVKALRARRHQGPTAGTDAGTTPAAPASHTQSQSQSQSQSQTQTQPRPQSQAPAAPRPAAPAVREKEPNAWGQAAAAVGLFVALGAALWLGPKFLPSDEVGAGTEEAVSCPGAEETGENGEELPRAYRTTPGAVTGEELCEALNRPDLPALLGTPTEIATSASGSSGTAPLTDEKIAQPEARVGFDTYTVDVLATYNKLTIDQYANLMKYGDETDVKRLTVLGRPAILSSDHMMSIQIDLGGSASGGPVGQGPLARTLTVALDEKDGGGYYDFTVWSESAGLPDDSVLVDVVETVLPAIPHGNV
ncbi:DUF6215 domain-containing protein [Streptomyces sp. CNZ748]|uniref:DUF6215 domain-containing protein n=1 Tax=Streptomyces sp. CNZ748 TaxID=2885160 RepID=UPI001E2A77B7|nr:DUF6215 domain-containing protein [Streptomyces sp. CNZ748]